MLNKDVPSTVAFRICYLAEKHVGAIAANGDQKLVKQAPSKLNQKLSFYICSLSLLCKADSKCFCKISFKVPVESETVDKYSILLCLFIVFSF